MRPMRQALPAMTPRPAPISMPYSSSRRLRVPGVVRSFGDADAIQGMKGSLRDVGQAHGLQTGTQPEVHSFVAGDAVFQALLQHDGQGLAQGVGHVDRGGVVIDAPATAAGVVFA
jgi:hypothetical protein